MQADDADEDKFAVVFLIFISPLLLVEAACEEEAEDVAQEEEEEDDDDDEDEEAEGIDLFLPPLLPSLLPEVSFSVSDARAIE
jgi:hypothetical protein